MSVPDGPAPTGYGEPLPPLYVALRADLSSYRQGESRWAAPDGDRPGPWKRRAAADTPAEREDGIEVRWLAGLPAALGTRIFRVEADEIVAISPDGVLARRARLLWCVEDWDARAARHYAADCAEMVRGELDWPLPDDDIPLRAIQATRLQADGVMTVAYLHEVWAALHAASRAFTCDIPCIESWLAAWATLDALVEPDPGDAARLAARAASQALVAAATWRAGWTAAQDAAWTAQTPAVTEALRRSAQECAQDEVARAARAWQAARLSAYLGLAESPAPGSLAPPPVRRAQYTARSVTPAP